MPRTYMLPIESIVNKYDVRVSLDDDRILQFAGMYEAGEPLPPIQVIKLPDTDGYAFVDGRTRAAARDLLGLKDVEAVVLNIPSNEVVLLYATAMQANWGGSKPPTRLDIVHTITRMFEAGATQAQIRESMCFLPAGSLKAYITDARGKITRRKISKALNLIAQGQTIGEATRSLGLKEEMVQDVLTGTKGKFGNKSIEQALESQIKAYISQQLRSANAGIGKKIQDLLERAEASEISLIVAKECTKAWGEHLRKTSSRIKDWEARISTMEESFKRLEGSK